MDVTHGFTFTTTGNTVEITGTYFSDWGPLTIPKQIGGKNVSSIKDEAFFNYIGLTSITIPDSVVNIGHSAFSGCVNLSNVKLPNSLQNIKNSTFKETGLKSIIIPSSVVTIGEQAFANTPNLVSVTFDRNLSTNYHATAFNNSNPEMLVPYNQVGAYLSRYPDKRVTDRSFEYAGLGNIIIGFSSYGREALQSASIVYFPGFSNGRAVTEIAAGAFANESGSFIFMLPESITKIGNNAFKNMSGLTGIAMPGVTQVGNSAFEECTALTNVGMRDVITIGDYAFKNVPIAVAGPNGNPVFHLTYLTSVGVEAFYGSTIGATAMAVSFPNLQTIGDRAFMNCKELRTIFGTANIKTIGDSAFAGTNITSINLENVTHIGAYAFASCTQLTSVNLFSLETLGEGAFASCYYLASVNFGDNNTLTEIPDNAFENCIELTEFTFPYSVTKIGYGAFTGCTKLTSVTIHSFITQIVGDPFALSNNVSIIWYYNPNLIGIVASRVQTVIIPDGTTAIADNAFEWFANLTQLELPNSIVSVGNNAFHPNTQVNWQGNYSFRGSQFLGLLDNPTEFAIPQEIAGRTITSIGANAFLDQTQLTQITIPDSVTHIAGGAFRGTYALSEFLIDPANTAFTVQDGILYNFTTLIHAPYSVSGHVVVPQFITEIADYAFENRSLLNQITLPASIQRIGVSAFENTSSLTQINFQSSSQLQEIAALSFANSGINSIQLPQSLLFIGDGAFLNCVGLMDATVPNNLIRIGLGAFQGCENLQSMTLPFVGEHAYATETAHFAWLFGFENGWQMLYSGFAPAIHLTLTGGTTIADIAFVASSIQSIVIPDTVTHIGHSAFMHSQLQSVVIPDSVTHIATAAFSYCDNLTYVEIGNGVTQLGYAAFFGSAVEEFVIGNGLEFIGDVAFLGTKASVLDFRHTNLTHISYGAFDGNIYLQEVYLPATVEVIEFSAFFNCPQLTIYADIAQADKPNGWIEEDEQHWNPDNRPVVWADSGTDPTDPDPDDDPDNFGMIGSSITGYFGTSSAIAIPEEVDGIAVTAIAPNAFADNTSLTSVSIPHSVTSIGLGAFSGTESLETLSIPFSGQNRNGGNNTHFGYIFGAQNMNGQASFIPQSLKTVRIDGLNGTQIANNAFNGMGGVETVIIADGVTAIGSDAFRNNSALTFVEIASTVSNIANAFGNSPNAAVKWHFNASAAVNNFRMNLTEVVIPDTVTALPNNAFRDSVNLVSVTIPNSVTSIGNSAFQGCVSLTEIALPASITEIGAHAFNGCTSLTSIIIPHGVTTIRDNTFNGCSALTSIVIPASVTQIQSDAFRNCNALTTVYYGGESAAQFNAINTGNNTQVVNANRYYYSETEPATQGNYWHFDHGVPTAW
ncbi:MAG: leucine-rich repeat domain-containing protein [Firmicutes bacterium]|nr:leucine-rich repeat domain-containing protein [Bacillota bacterium]